MKLDKLVRNTEGGGGSQSWCIHCVGSHPNKNDLRNIERINEIINHPSIHATLIISILNFIVGNKIRASDVDWRMTSFANCPKPDTTENNFHWNTENPKTRAYRLKIYR